MLQRWLAVGKTASDLTHPRFEPQTLSLKTITVPLDQLVGWARIKKMTIKLHAGHVPIKNFLAECLSAAGPRGLKRFF